MAEKKHIYSTLSQDNLYTLYKDGPNDQKIPHKEILVKGGAGVANRKTADAPAGVKTTIDADDLQYLDANEVFQIHKKNGFIIVSDRDFDPEVAAADMQGRDGGAQIREEDIKANGGAQLKKADDAKK